MPTKNNERNFLTPIITALVVGKAGARTENVQHNLSSEFIKSSTNLILWQYEIWHELIVLWNSDLI